MSHEATETYDVYNEDFRAARTKKKCDACDRRIGIGHVYCHVSILFQGKIESVNRCGACQQTHEYLRTKDSEMWPDERLACGLDYEEEWGGPPPERIEALPLLSDDEAGQLLTADRNAMIRSRAQIRAVRRERGLA